MIGKRMFVEIDVETGSVVRVTNGEQEVKGVPVKNFTFGLSKGDYPKPPAVVSIPNHTVITTHSSPGCTTYIFNGIAYTICN